MKEKGSNTPTLLSVYLLHCIFIYNKTLVYGGMQKLHSKGKMHYYKWTCQVDNLYEDKQ